VKIVILAGVIGKLLYLLTKVKNKHLLPVGKELRIFNPILQLLSSGITDILVVTGKGHMGEIVRLLGSGSDFDCNFTFRVQENAEGITDAHTVADVFSSGGRIVVILGDNILIHSIRKYVDAFKKQPTSAKVLLKRVGDPERFGVAAFDERNKMIMQIEEKPEPQKSDYAGIGVYMHDSFVFDVIQNITPSECSEFETTSVNNWYVEHAEITYDVIWGEWSDAGTFELLMQANTRLFPINNTIQKVEDE